MDNELRVAVLAWVDNHFVGRPWKPNREFVAEHIIEQCQLTKVDELKQAEQKGDRKSVV